MYISRHVIKMHIFGQLFIIGNIAIVPSSLLYKVFHKDVESIVVFLSLQTFSRPQFQRSSPLKPRGQSKPNFMWSILRKGERKFI